MRKTDHTKNCGGTPIKSARKTLTTAHGLLFIGVVLSHTIFRVESVSRRPSPLTHTLSAALLPLQVGQPIVVPNVPNNGDRLVPPNWDPTDAEPTCTRPFGPVLDSTYKLVGQSTSTGGNLLSNPVAKPINAKINSLVNHVVLEVSKAFSPAMAVAA